MANASLEPIYDRLNGVPQYHPFSAKTFTDWASEAGDTVQISREGTVYTAPVHKQSLVWRGKHMINMQSTGTRERTPIERMSNQKQNETSAGMSSSRGYGGGAGKAIKALQYDFYDEDGIYHSQLYMDEQRFTTIFTKTGIDGLPEGTSLMTRINQNAEEISLEAIRARGAENELSSRLTVNAEAITAETTQRINAILSVNGRLDVEAGKVAMVVGTNGYGNYIKAAEIAISINESTGQGEARIDAGHVYIGNDKSTTVIAGKLNASDVTAEYLNAKIGTIPTLNGISASFSGNVSAAGGVTGSGIYYTGGSGTQSLHEAIKLVQVVPDGNNYKLQYQKFNATGWQDASTFSRAIASWTLGWSGGTFTAKANPQNQSAWTQIVQGTTTWDGNIATVPIEAIDSDTGGHQYATGRSILVDATSKAPASGSASGRSGTTYDWSFAIKNSSGTTIKNLTIDCSAIYSDARVGYTQGTFTLASVTLQGSRNDNVYVKSTGSGTTTYYTAGSATTVYPGNGGSFTPQGTAAGDITAIGSARWFKQHSKSETPTGTWYSFHTSDPGGTTYKMYFAGTTHTNLRNPGSGTKYDRGTAYSVTPIGSTSITLKKSTYYSAGSTVSDTYYTKS